ncbi:MAG TPA: TIGR03435 family protein [Bryobacteraceae bacterium]|jgi:uncharacterized protein (TIGR03435 family)|nr:TIGR03435 family protein [Bryobacteraceae bacterium]
MHRAIAAAILVVSSGVVFGQSFVPVPTPLPEFDAVSVKPNKSGDPQMTMRPGRGGRVNATNVPLRNLIVWAYMIRGFQLSGEPSWVDSERFDVATTSDANPRYDVLQPTLETMFQAVLVDRFKLQVHHDTKELPVYSLVVAKNGPKIHAVDEEGCPEVPPPDNPCRFLRPTKFGQMTGKKAPMFILALLLSSFTGRTVVDKTDLKGSFDYTLDWTKYLQPPQVPPGADVPPGAFDPMSVEPAIASALEEQLGLKLESSKGPVEILVIDHVERPTEN